MRRVLFAIIICLTLLVGCSPVKQLNVDKVSLSEFRMESSTKANIVFKFHLENRASFPVELVFMEATVKKDLDLFATIDLKEAVSVSPLFSGDVFVPVEVTLCDPMSLLSMGLNIRNWDINEFTVTGKMTFAGKNGAKASHKIKDMPLGTLINRIKQ